ncbi:AI-2E family transporter [Methanosarcina sp. T3]|uniref:AI-2E family transporter n=1 Tax=Methanosarcina sp. T3 TaxID=3439062 RepID=UPI003F8736C1
MILYLEGIDFAILWGILTFLFGYVPYLGFFLAAFPPTLLGLFKYGITGAFAVFASIWLINALVENILFPSLAGKSLKLSPSTVFLSLIYWTYVLGPSGALIAVPLTMVVKMLMERSEDMSWMVKFMEPGQEKS